MTGGETLRAAGLAVLTALGAHGPAAADTPPPSSLEGPVWVLTHLGGAPFEAEAQLTFTRREDGSPMLAGRGPCNLLSGAWTGAVTGGPFAAGPLAVTRRACDALDAEGRFLAALQAAREARLDGTTLTLGAPDAPALVFEAAPVAQPRD